MGKKLIYKQNQPIDSVLGIAVLIISGLVLPLILIPVVKLIGFSEIFEEIVKALVVLFVILRFGPVKQKIFAGIFFGFLFGVSENLLYLNNILQIGDISIFWQRFFVTVPMHIITTLIVLFSGLKSHSADSGQAKKYIILGTLLAIILHLFFNYFVTSLVSV